MTSPYKDSATYFQNLSTAYRIETGNATYDIIHSFLKQYFSLTPPIFSNNATIHDNACGEGTATLAVLSLISSDPNHKHLPRIEATDLSPGMIAKLEETIQTHNLQDKVAATIADSHKLPFEPETFTMSITNISVTNFADPSEALSEIHRTLKPSGLAVVSIWKRFAPAVLIHNAQRAVKGSKAVLMPVPQAEFFEEEYLRDCIVDAGFRDVRQCVQDTLVQGQDLRGLREFMAGSVTRVARMGWTSEEEARWADAVDEQIAAEVERNGGIAMSAWIVTGTK